MTKGGPSRTEGVFYLRMESEQLVYLVADFLHIFFVFFTPDVFAMFLIPST
jgi:hypothetical protein